MATTKRGMTGACAPVALLLLSMSLLPAALAQKQNTPDNSANNKVQNRSQTADRQTNKTSDRELTAKIRRAVVADKSLSTYAHNVKIIVLGGAVTLKGPVHSDAEKQAVEAKAADVVGQGKVTNQLTIKQ